MRGQSCDGLPVNVTVFCAFIFLGLSLTCAVCSAQHTDDISDEPRPIFNVETDFEWSDPTREAAKKFLKSHPAADLTAVFLQLLTDEDLTVRRDALSSLGRIELANELARRLALIAAQDPDPLCQARARLILAERPVVRRSVPPPEHLIESRSPRGFGPESDPERAIRPTVPAPRKRFPDAVPVEEPQHITTADFHAPEQEQFESISEAFPAAGHTVFQLRKVSPTGFSSTELPPSPTFKSSPFPRLLDTDTEDIEVETGVAPGLLDRPITNPEEVFDYPPEVNSWPLNPTFAPLGYSGKSGIIPVDVQEDEHFVPVTDRWRSGFPDWDRYGDGPPFGVDKPYKKGHWWDPYNLNVLKGDYPVIGQHTFMRITGQLNSTQEYRQVPTPATDFESTAHPGSKQLFGNNNQYFTTNLFRMSVELFHGDTSFKPVDWNVRLTPVFDINYLGTNELGVVNTDVRRGTTRYDDFMALEEYFVEAKLQDLSTDYDFMSGRVGSQPFTSDFRGFIFSDTNRAVRLFGTRLANRDQFNIIAFRQAEKDTNSLLNTFEDRNQNILIANYYRQDFIFPGYTAQMSIHYNNDGPAQHYDTNGFLVRPDPAGVALPHRVQATYLGLAGDGHIGRINVSNAFYWVTGRDSMNPIAGDSQRINAQMAAVELSYDRDWIRFRTSFFYASGDKNPYDHTAKGFDTILDNPNFAGGQFSYWQRQQINLQGVGLTNRLSLVPDLRNTKFEGQSNFVNPGLRLFNLGMDFELTPRTRLITNANYLQFDSVNVLQAFTFQNQIRRNIGVDLSAGLEYRPLLSDNIILTGGYACLIPGGGFRDLYGTTQPFTPSNNSSPSLSFLNSAFAQCILQF